MKIATIDLTAYGPFTGVTLDLPASGPGLSVIYGHNEAGKSSALRAIYALLFGIDRRTPDNFIHAYQDLKLSARLINSNGASIEFLRIKRDKHSLLDPRSLEPLPDDALIPFLGSVSESAFKTLFKIGHLELREGGEELAKGKGDFGATLFQASAGGRQMRALLEDMEKAADDLFRPRASTAGLNKALADLMEAQANISRYSLSYNAWKNLTKDVAEKRGELERIKAEQQEKAARLSKLDRIANISPSAGALKDILEALDAKTDVLVLPDDFAERRKNAVTAREQARRRVGDLENRLQILRGKQAAVQIREAALARESRISGLHQKIGVYEQAQIDLPEIGKLRDLAILKARAILEEIAPDTDQAKAPDLILDAKTRRALEELLREYADGAGALKAAQKNRAEVAEELEALEREQAALPGVREIPGLTAALKSAEKAEDGEAHLAEIQTRLEARRQDARARLVRLIPAGASLEQAPSLPVPGRETVSRFQDRLQKAESAVEKIEDRLREQTQNIQILELQIKKSREAGGLPSESDLENARDRRRTGWELVKKDWLQGPVDETEKNEYAPGGDLAAAYEADVGTADDIADRLRRDAERVARMAAMTVECRDCREKTEALNRELEQARQTVGDVEGEWRTLWEPVGVVPRSPAEMLVWGADFEKLLRAIEELRDLEQEFDRESRWLEGRRRGLAACLESVLPGEVIQAAPLKALIEAARQTAGRSEAAAKHHADIQTRLRSAQNRWQKTTREERGARERLDLWQDAWKSAVSNANVPHDLAPSFAGEYLRQTKELQIHLKDIREADLRIGQMDQAVQSFTEDISEVVQQVAPEFGLLPPEQAAKKLNDLLNDMKKKETQKRELEERIKELENELEEAGLTLRSQEAEVKRHCAEANCQQEEDLGKREEESEAIKRLRERRVQLEELIRSHGGGKSLPELLSEASEIEPDRLAGQREALNRELDTLSARLETTQQELGVLQKELQSLDTRDDAMRASEAAEGHISRVQELARDYARQRIAAELLRREFDFYKEQRGPELKRASDLFARFTLGSFERLIVDLDQNDQPLLKGKPRGRDPIETEQMSDGTRDQLYLALRLALLEQYMKKNEPLPILLDDIFVHFDDQRAGAALKALGDLGGEYQILLFTHHRHLVDLAKHTLGAESFNLRALD